MTRFFEGMGKNSLLIFWARTKQIHEIYSRYRVVFIFVEKKYPTFIYFLFEPTRLDKSDIRQGRVGFVDDKQAATPY